ncbi:MAG: Zinc finger, type [Gammaproteobacteria bacterium]|nr:Zinc finger, type [Gammaproteobacteria bacterium]
MSPSQAIHVWSRCHHCGMNPITGPCFRCETCPLGPDIDLCSACFAGYRTGRVAHAYASPAGAPATHRFVRSEGSPPDGLIPCPRRLIQLHRCPQDCWTDRSSATDGLRCSGDKEPEPGEPIWLAAAMPDRSGRVGLCAWRGICAVSCFATKKQKRYQDIRAARRFSTDAVT